VALKIQQSNQSSWQGK